MTNNNKSYVIVLGRQFGCGARVIGKKLAEALGIPYYDKELLQEAAKESGVNSEYIAANDERSPSVASSLWSFNLGFGSTSYMIGSSTFNGDNVYKAQCDVIKQLAAQGPCVIVGRTADFILRDICNVISIFIHASIDDRINRIIDRGDCDNEDQARELAIKHNKARAGYYNFYTDRTWGAADNYDLAINASPLGIDATVDAIEAYVRRRLGSI